MAIVLWIVGTLCVLMGMIALLRVGVQVSLHGGELAVDVKAGPFRFRVFPGKEQKQPGASKASEKTGEKKTVRGKEGTEKAPAKAKLPKLSLTEIKDLITTLWPPLKKALGRTRRGIRIDPLHISLTMGGEADPAEAAQRYGQLYGAIWTGMPILERLIDIREPHIHMGLDFQAPETTAEGTAGVSVSVGTLLAIVWNLAVPAVKWFLNRQRTQQKPTQPMTAADAVH